MSTANHKRVLAALSLALLSMLCAAVIAAGSNGQESSPKDRQASATSRPASVEPTQSPLLQMMLAQPVQVTHIPRVSSTNRITFRVADVIFATNLLPTGLESYDTEGLAAHSVASTNVVRLSWQSDGVHVGNHLIRTLMLCYNEHRPLVLAPDHFWLLICQGVADHVNSDPEKYRHLFVEHEGKKTIRVRNQGGVEKLWNQVIEEFAAQATDNVKGDLGKIMCTEFSTSSPIEKTAFRICFLGSMKEYYTYWTDGACGFPEITLEGTPADWRKLLENTEQLRQYELDWWIDELVPILEEFVKTAEGNPDTDFWNSMYKDSHAYNRHSMNGWITTFFPYDDGKRNSFVPAKSRSFSDIPKGVTECETVFTIHGAGVGEGIALRLEAGFMGIDQDRDTMALCPLINWRAYWTGAVTNVNVDELRANLAE